MEKLTCSKCDGYLKIGDGCLICTHCGAKYAVETAVESETNTAIETSENAVVLVENKPSKWSNINWGCIRGWTIVLAVVLLLVWFYTSTSHTNMIKGVLKKNHYNDLELVEYVRMGYEYDYLVLLRKTKNGVTRYGMGAVKLEGKKVTDLVFGYAPLNLVVDSIFLGSEAKNLEHLQTAASFISQHGIQGFNEQKTAEEYLRILTRDGGIMNCQLAREIIINSIEYILPDIRSAPDFYVVFEKGNANPTHYAAQSSEMRYNWSHIFTENVYKVWRANTDRKTQDIMTSIHGQPYVKKEVWAVVDKNLKLVGTFNSLAAVKDIFETRASASKTIK